MEEDNRCKYCGKKIAKNKQFCDGKCSNKFRHNQSYNDFLENSEKYCKGNYTPKNFKDKFLVEQDHKCAICGNPDTWNGQELHLVIDHIDGDASNNRRENLRMICPNCDSQLPTFKSRNKHSTRRNYWKEKIYRDLGKEMP